MIDLYPTKCNLCGGPVVYTSNAIIYNGREYGSGKCYLCKNCGAYVGTHKPNPRKAMGILANEEMRNYKILCHDLFDVQWDGYKGKEGKRRRAQAYRDLAVALNIPFSECHFGYFDLDQLKRAYSILLKQTTFSF